MLFCDIVNSTGLAEAYGDETLHELVRDVLESGIAEVRRYDGTVPQFTGDGFEHVVPCHARQHAELLIDDHRPVRQVGNGWPAWGILRIDCDCSSHTAATNRPQNIFHDAIDPMK